MNELHARVLQANIEVHTRLSASYEATEPHFRPENQERVRAILRDLKGRSGGDRLLDLGCGTGFLLNLARGLFADIHGVDATPAMLERVANEDGLLQLHCGPAEQLPYADDSFDVVTAYSFLHHLADYKLVLAEARRVLRPGGLFYADLDPHRAFWEKMVELSTRPGPYSDWLQTAIDSVVLTDARIEEQYAIPKETFNTAEYSKAILGGYLPSEIVTVARSLGFSEAEAEVHWYVGQAPIMHGESPQQAEKFESYLRKMSPLCDHLFKYVRMVLTK